MSRLIIYIHGFLCTNNPPRVAALQQFVDERKLDIVVQSPQLPGKPKQAVEQLEQLIEAECGNVESVALIGHSLGAYFAAYLATKYHLRAVLLNPVIHGYQIMCEYIGQCYSPHFDERVEIDVDDIEYLVTLDGQPEANKQSVLVLQQLGDEILDPLAVLSYFHDYSLLVEKGGNHDFVGFERHFETAIHFLFDCQVL